MKNTTHTLFLCAKCADIIQECYDTEEVPNTFARDKCAKCSKLRFGCKYEVKK